MRTPPKPMKLHAAAAKIAAAGRGGDSMIMHVGPGEAHALSGLAALSGRSLTTNPQTGMLEAFSLSDIIPYAAPIAAGMMFGPMGAAAASGLSTYATTGDPRKAMLSGLSGAALGSMMGGLGSTTPGVTPGVTDAATQGATDAGVNGSLDAATAPGITDYTAAAGSNLSPTDQAYAQGFTTGTAPTTTPASGISGLSGQSPQQPSTWSQKLDAMQDAKWTGKDSMLQNADGSYKMAPIIAGGSMLGLAGLDSNQGASDDYAKQAAADKALADKKFRYYQSMAGKMPANMIPAYPG